MKSRTKLIQILSVVGLLGGLAATISIIIVGDTFGLPGSASYRIYENFNRLMAILIALETCAMIGFYFQQKDVFGNIERTALLIALIAWIGMAAGTVAEFWLYSDLPYGEDNLRNTAFSIFSISSLVAGLALLALGMRTLIRRQLPRYYSIVLILYLPIDIALFVTGQSIFLTSALVVILIAGLTLRSSSALAASSQEAT